MVFKPPVNPTFDDVSYVKDGHVRQKLDIYYPPPNDSVSFSSPISGSSVGSTPALCLTPDALIGNGYRYPLVVYIHGGAFRFGSRKSDYIPWHILTRSNSQLHSRSSVDKREQGSHLTDEPDDDVNDNNMNNPRWAVASIDYRLSGDATFPAAVQDCKAAIRFLRANHDMFSLDPDCVVVWGESAGAHCACMLGALSPFQTDHEARNDGAKTTDNSADSSTDDSTGVGGVGAGEIQFDVGDHLNISGAVQGVIDYYGPTDFSLMDDQLAPSLRSKQSHNSTDSPESLYLGKQITLIPDTVALANPITYIDRASMNGLTVPPFLIAHGTLDKIVACGQSEILKDAILKVDRSSNSGNAGVEFIPIDGADHCFLDATDVQMASLNRATRSWLDVLYTRIQRNSKVDA